MVFTAYFDYVVNTVAEGVSAQCADSCGDTNWCNAMRFLAFTAPSVGFWGIFLLACFDPTALNWFLSGINICNTIILFGMQTFVQGMTAGDDTCFSPELRRPCVECALVWVIFVFRTSYYLSAWWSLEAHRGRRNPDYIPNHVSDAGVGGATLRVLLLLGFALLTCYAFVHTRLFSMDNILWGSGVGLVVSAAGTWLFWWVLVPNFQQKLTQSLLDYFNLDRLTISH